MARIPSFPGRPCRLPFALRDLAGGSRGHSRRLRICATTPRGFERCRGLVGNEAAAVRARLGQGFPARLETALAAGPRLRPRRPGVFGSWPWLQAARFIPALGLPVLLVGIAVSAYRTRLPTGDAVEVTPKASVEATRTKGATGLALLVESPEDTNGFTRVAIEHLGEEAIGRRVRVQVPAQGGRVRLEAQGAGSTWDVLYDGELKS